ncbi:MAG TPA: zinc ABC transporter substrate-binding protein [Campylobacteraceae bacterium]|nr:zinc ABC transporter substrate-binding protein [Campylobacteraceae bacterium]HHD83948.1 zinc ABC transporter substrate-binding protein [Campylobacteraceae bacterium]
MKKIALITLLTAVSLFAKVNVATTYAYLGKITEHIGGKYVHVDVLADPKRDPHFIVPRPSLIGKLRREDLLIINGGQLEIGWLPPLLKSANNPKIRVGQKGFLDVSGVIEMINKPQNVSRAYGDIHPGGNPHFGIDVHNVLPIAQLIALKLEQIDPAHADAYAKNLKNFQVQMQELITKLDAKMRPCRGKKVVEYHALYDYALRAYGLVRVGTIEPLPGITPSSRHTLQLINLMRAKGVKLILQDVYHEKKTARFIAEKTGAKVVILPHDVGSVPGSETLVKFYTMIAERLCR